MNPAKFTCLLKYFRQVCTHTHTGVFHDLKIFLINPRISLLLSIPSRAVWIAASVIFSCVVGVAFGIVDGSVVVATLLATSPVSLSSKSLLLNLFSLAVTGPTEQFVEFTIILFCCDMLEVVDLIEIS